MNLRFFACTIIIFRFSLDAASSDSTFVPSHRWQGKPKPLRCGRESEALRLAMSTSSKNKEVQRAGSSSPKCWWTWHGHDVYTEVSYGKKNQNIFSTIVGGQKRTPRVLLIHGFGCSTTYWRSTVASLLAAGYEVHSLDLLGQGRSAKPEDIPYSINLWAEQIDDYAREVMDSGNKKDEQADVILMGNSLGSLVALAAVTGDHASSNSDGGDCEGKRGGFLHQVGCVRGICMFNCGIGLNSRGIARAPGRNAVERFLINAVLFVFDVLVFNNRPLLSYLLDDVVTKDLLRSVLRNLYTFDPSRVDDELVDSIYYPAKEEGAVEVLRQIYTNDPGLTPMDIHSKYAEQLPNVHSNSGGNLPIQLIWGDEDAVTPLSGSVGQFYASLAKDPKLSVNLDTVSAGHIPFDDNPDESNVIMMRWIKSILDK